MRNLTTKQVSLRLGEEALRHLNYLSGISHKSQAAIVADLVSVYYHAVLVEAFGSGRHVPDPELLRDGGTLITVEEQRALASVRDRLAGTWETLREKGR